MSVVMIEGIAVNCVRKDVQNMSLTIKRDCSAHLTIPKGIDNDEVMDFLKSKVKWMRKHIENYAEIPMEHEHDYQTGDKFTIFDEEYTLIASEAGRYHFSIRDNIIYGTFRRDSTVEQRRKNMDKFLSSLLAERISLLLPKWEEVTGLKCSSWSVKQLRGKWGCCLIKEKIITFNLTLITKTDKCIEYIILHELAHIKYRYHDEKFKALLTKYMPDWKEINKQLTYSV